MELRVICNNCFCGEICSECKQWFECTDLIAFLKVDDEGNSNIICPSCFLKSQREMQDKQAIALFGAS